MMESIISLCFSSPRRKSRRKSGSDHLSGKIEANPSALTELQEHKLKEALEEASEDGSFLRADCKIESADSIPLLDDAFSKFLTMYPKYQLSERIDQLRSDEYFHLSGASSRTCLDYCGFGLFSLLQTVQNCESSTFCLSETTANLSNYALYGGAEKGTVEHDIKTKIMAHLNLPENEYSLIFTVSRGSAFKLLSESYPFHINKRLLTMLDHESQSLNWMAQSAREKGAKVQSAWFKWPTLKPLSTDLRKQISDKKRRKKDSASGLFVFPVQSRVTGAKYSYQWMALAQQNNWHVLLDAGALGPKDMDSLGLSLFRPDFIITSFYRVFGYDPTGFGCLLIKKSVTPTLHTKSGHAGCGIVKITPVFPLYLSDSMDYLPGCIENGEANENGDLNYEVHAGTQLPAFSGAYTCAQVRDVFEGDMEHDNGSYKNGANTISEEADSVSFGEVVKSPVFSEDESSDSSLWIDLGQSLVGSDHSGHSDKENVLSPLPPSWLSNKKNNKLTSPKPSTLSNGLMNGEKVNSGNTSSLLSFDAAIRSIPQELDHFKDIPEEEMFTEVHPTSRESRTLNSQFFQEREPEVDISNNPVKGSSLGSERCVSHHGVLNGVASEICIETKDNAITRETEGEFRLLERRERSRISGGRFFGLKETGQPGSNRGRVSFDKEVNHQTRLSQSQEQPDLSASSMDVLESLNNEDYDDGHDSDRCEPEIICRHLDHIKVLSLNKTTSRLRFLVNWLAASLLQLRLPDSDGTPLVHLYGPKVKYERGAAIAFNLRGVSGELISPEIVQKLAESHNISLGVGILSHIRMPDSPKHQHRHFRRDDTALSKPTESLKHHGKGGFITVEVVTASFGFLTNFEDVYKLWAFMANFLDPNFLKENLLPSSGEDGEE